ncbi:hypothetical protein BKA63DRAFT_528087 [Paraphoma chrysanthemicola]|nr:hypothetical protein BKA63DRAFT_528087 [Paraphoma chrysanthemicola]
MSRISPVVQFARYVDNQVELFKERTDQLQYVAISHVWGEIDWRHVKGIPHEIKVSEKKAKFIEERLPALVGDGAFWMDTITVNQRDQAEVIDTVQSIPAIFRDATRTIAVREGDGFYPCCQAATEGFTDWEDFGQKLQKHSGDHYEHAFDETYLSRLWTLQECQLSHTIQFVRTDDNTEARVKEPDETSDPYRYLLNYQKKTDALYVLAHTFDDNVPAIEAFVRAYMSQGTVTRDRRSPRSASNDIYSDNFFFMNLSSSRRATKPRDYMFATMPQFPWYHYPANAETMSFSTIFQDFYNQAIVTGHPFAHRITRSMTSPKDCSSAEEAWLPSNNQPEPKTLGDFLKLLGHKIRSESKIGQIHLCSVVRVELCPAAPDFDRTMAIVEDAMKFSSRIWQESHLGDELSMYGSWPEDVDNKDSWLKLAMMSWARPNPSTEHSEEERAAMLAGIQAEYDKNIRTRLEKPWLHKQARRILDLKWCATNTLHVSRPHQGDWRSWSRDLPKQWSAKLQEAVYLLAAMVSCQIPLSAVEWADDHFTPVLITFNTTTILGLFATHAVTDKIKAGGEVPSFCVGRHPAEQPLGKDLVLVDIFTKMPVGLVPDFLELMRTDEEFVDRVKELYHTVQPNVGPRGAMFPCVNLDDIEIR